MPSKYLRQLARRCSLRCEVLGAIGYGTFVATVTALAWLLGNIGSAAVAFLVAAGLAFLHMDVDALPSDDECKQFNDSPRL